MAPVAETDSQVSFVNGASVAKPLVEDRLCGPSSSRVAARLRYGLIALTAFLGFLQAWASRMDLVSDTVSYLDIGDGIWKGHWSMAINGLWGPLYSALLGAAVGTVRPSLYWEYPLVHLVVFFIFLFTLWGFDFFLRELIFLRHATELPETCAVPDWVWLLIGYTIFMWTALQVIQVSETNPDMLVAAFFYIACGLLVRIRRNAAGWPAFLALGAALGLGYLTKSIMFPVSLLCLTAAAVIGPRSKWRAVPAIAAFAVIAGPFVVGLSMQKGRLTFGESGRYNYAVHVNHLPRTHWQGDAENGRPVHGSRQIFDRPAAFEFATPLSGTYPAWTDPSYWYEGLHSPIHLGRSLQRSLRLLQEELVFFFELHGALIATLFLLFYVSGRNWNAFRDVAAHWFLLLPALGALFLYALIHIEPRYLAPFVATVALCLFFSVRLADTTGSARLAAGVAIFLFAMFICPVESTSWHLREFVRDVTGHSRPDLDSYQAMATEMRRLGLKPGDRVASLEYSLYGMSTWARLARAQITTEVYYGPILEDASANNFWQVDPVTQQKLIQAIEKTGVRVIVSSTPPIPADSPGWHRVGETRFYAYWFSPAPAATNVSSALDIAREPSLK